MDHAEMEGETQIGTTEEIAAPKTTPGKTVVEKKAKSAKPGNRSFLPLLIALLVIGLGGFAGMNYFKLREEIEGLQKVVQGLRTESDTKGRTIATLTTEKKDREEALQKSHAEASQLKGQVETLRLAMMERDGQIARLQQTAQFSAKLPKRTKELQSQLVQKQIENASLQNALTHQTEWIRLLSSPTAQLIRMAGAKEAGAAHGLILFDPKAQTAAFYGYDLPKPPAGKVYQLWTIDAAPISAGLFQPANDRTAVVKMPKIHAEKVKEFAVTLEPAGGKPHPSGPVYLKGAVAGVSPS